MAETKIKEQNEVAAEREKTYLEKHLENKKLVEGLSLAERMNLITYEMGSVAKNLNVSIGSGSYKAVSEVDVLAAVKPLEFKYGVRSYPLKRNIIFRDLLEESTRNGIRTSYYSEIETIYRFESVDNKEDFIDVTAYSTGIDNGDKGYGKAMTYGDKYALMKAYKISTGDDPDQKGSEDNNFKPKGTKTSKNEYAELDKKVKEKRQVKKDEDITPYSFKESNIEAILNHFDGRLFNDKPLNTAQVNAFSKHLFQKDTKDLTMDERLDVINFIEARADNLKESE